MLLFTLFVHSFTLVVGEKGFGFLFLEHWGNYFGIQDGVGKFWEMGLLLLFIVVVAVTIKTNCRKLIKCGTATSSMESTFFSSRLENLIFQL